MKPITLIILLLLLTNTLAYSLCRTEPFSLIRDEARKSNKYILVTHGYFSNPNDNDPFIDEESATYFDENYIVARYKKEFDFILNFGTYPALLFFNPAGKLICIEFGVKSPQELVYLGKTAKLIDEKKAIDDLFVEEIKQDKQDLFRKISLITKVKRLSIDKNDPFVKTAKNKSNQSLWYTSNAICYYINEAIDIQNYDGKLVVSFNHMTQEEVNDLLFKAYFLYLGNPHVAYLGAIIAYHNNNLSDMSKYLDYFLNYYKPNDLPENILQNVKIMKESLWSLAN